MKKRIAALILAVLMAASVMGGCAAGKVAPSKYATTAIATIGDDTIYMDELNYYVRVNQYESEQMGMLESYGISKWTDPVNFYNIITYIPADSLRDQAMTMVRQAYVMANEAEKAGITLSAKDVAAIADAINEFLAGDEALVKAVDLSADRLKEILTRNALANKMYEQYSATVDTTVTDDEALQYDVTYLAIGPTTLLDLDVAEGMTAEKLANEIVDKVNEGSDLTVALKGYELKGTPITMGDSDFADTFGPTVAKLEVGKAAAVESKNAGTFYVVVRDSLKNDEATASKKAELEAKKISEAFAKVYPDWEAAYAFEAEYKLIDGLEVSDPIYVKK